MPLIHGQGSEAQEMVDGWMSEAGHRLKARREKGMEGTREYVVTEQVFNGYRTLDRGEKVYLTEEQAEQLHDYVKLAADPVKESAPLENRMVSGAGKAGRSE